jgi:uncharacterized protein YndB with AHSA1/START domain
MSQMANELAVRKSIVVECPVETAFRVFTERTSDWWPFEGHSIFDEDAEAVVFEPRAGGRVYERSPTGEEGLWGSLTVWDPPNGFTMTWHPGRDASTAQELEVSFRPEGAATRVEVLHTGFERHEADGEAVRASYDRGWGTVLDLFADEARREA